MKHERFMSLNIDKYKFLRVTDIGKIIDLELHAQHYFRKYVT